MPYEFKFPDIGEGVVEGEIVRWLVEEGEFVDEDQPLVEVMTDKATVEIPSPLRGTIAERMGDEGEIIKVGTTMVVIEEEGKQSSAPKQPPQSQVQTVSHTSEGSGLKKDQKPHESPVLATPAVRRLARELGVELGQVQGSGPGGRITRKDVERFQRTEVEAGAEPVATQSQVEELPYRGVRKKIGDHLAISKRTAVHFTYVEEVDVTQLVSLRKRLQTSSKDLTYLPFVLKAAVEGLKEYPVLNSTLDEDQGIILLKKYYNIGIATDTPEGLMVPVVRDVDRKSVRELAEEVARLSQDAREGKAKLEDLRDGSFTITNLGPLGGVLGTPIINYPEVAILGLHKIAQKPVVRDGQIVIRDMMNLSISLDHRVADGAIGARFLHHLIAILEDPASHFSHGL